MNIQLLDVSDYLLSSFSYTTAVGLSNTLDGQVSHDKITRFLSKETWTSKDLWGLVKKTVRKEESNDSVLIFDDTTEEKQGIKAVAMDMWDAFMTATKTILPKADIVHDKFYIASYLGKAVDEVRRKENKLFNKNGNETLTRN